MGSTADLQSLRDLCSIPELRVEVPDKSNSIRTPSTPVRTSPISLSDWTFRVSFTKKTYLFGVRKRGQVSGLELGLDPSGVPDPVSL